MIQRFQTYIVSDIFHLAGTKPCVRSTSNLRFHEMSKWASNNFRRARSRPYRSRFFTIFEIHKNYCRPFGRNITSNFLLLKRELLVERDDQKPRKSYLWNNICTTVRRSHPRASRGKALPVAVLAVRLSSSFERAFSKSKYLLFIHV